LQRNLFSRAAIVKVFPPELAACCQTDNKTELRCYEMKQKVTRNKKSGTIESQQSGESLRDTERAPGLLNRTACVLLFLPKYRGFGSSLQHPLVAQSSRSDAASAASRLLHQ
jgi:hypothetical protein